MAILTVYIQPQGVSYHPSPPVARPGDTVSFVIDGRTDEVSVSFDSSSPFSGVSNFCLNGSTQITGSFSDLVIDNASGRYAFTVAPTTNAFIGGAHVAPPGTVRGGLEVSADPLLRAL
ncbi:hypothetical protein [Hyalangium versicolor]|uniref:hypothetical protein n=1 Tax=Hyalangium versicolor TaxID=2861190 RepID=UPI001CCDBBFC|nr:hypothetical protein [Hyalangium versicolor]